MRCRHGIQTLTRTQQDDYGAPYLVVPSSQLNKRCLKIDDYFEVCEYLQKIELQKTQDELKKKRKQLKTLSKKQKKFEKSDTKKKKPLKKEPLGMLLILEQK